MGFDLLVPRQPADANYIRLTMGGYSASEQIGCKGAGMQTIGGSDKFTVVHEMFHALGFKHEQLHKKFPWDDSDPKRLRVDRMFTYKGKLKTKNNADLYAAVVRAHNRPGGDFYVDNNLTSRLEAMLDADTEHWSDCDLDSVMMYDTFRSALIQANYAHKPGMISSGKSVGCDVLSNQDVDALRLIGGVSLRYGGLELPDLDALKVRIFSYASHLGADFPNVAG
jgi:hypothetical protein